MAEINKALIASWLKAANEGEHKIVAADAAKAARIRFMLYNVRGTKEAKMLPAMQEAAEAVTILLEENVVKMVRKELLAEAQAVMASLSLDDLAKTKGEDEKALEEHGEAFLQKLLRESERNKE